MKGALMIEHVKQEATVVAETRLEFIKSPSFVSTRLTQEHFQVFLGLADCMHMRWRWNLQGGGTIRVLGDLSNR